MRSIESNLIVGKSKSFALRCIRLYQLLIKERGEFVLSKQLLRSGTSIGANVKEAIRGQSKADFAMKLNIALKEASESEYWIIGRIRYSDRTGVCKHSSRLPRTYKNPDFNTKNNL